MIQNDITILITSCWRFNLLKKTIISLWDNIDLSKYNKIMTEDSLDKNHIKKIEKAMINWFLKWWKVIFTNWIKQYWALFEMYKNVSSKYIFHCEDDWYFKKTDCDFFNISIKILENNSNIWIVLLRDFYSDWWLNDINKNENDRFDELFLHNSLLESNTEFIFTNNTITWDWWNGFSYNPWMRRTNEMKKIMFWYENYVNEFEVWKRYKELWLNSINMKEWIVVHIWNSYLSTNFKKLFENWLLIWIKKVIKWTFKYRLWLLIKYFKNDNKNI